MRACIDISQDIGLGTAPMEKGCFLQAGAKSTAASSLKFQAEATAHLQSSGVPRTNDAPKYEEDNVQVTEQHIDDVVPAGC